VEGNIEMTVVANGTGNKFQWQNYKNDIFQANDRCLTVPFSDGEYRCKVTNIMATELTLISEMINPAFMSVDESKTEKIQIFPNPASNLLLITITIYNQLGETIFKLKVNSSIRIDISNFAVGCYYLKYGNDIYPFVKM